jgi:peptidoglycan/xylan/chitin deacetylase (PgdA/CDA1 family)
MNRRWFLAGGGTAVLAAGAALGADPLGQRRARELDAGAVAAAPGGRLGQRRLVWSVPTTAPLVALTFDDGPDPEFTPRILAVLAAYGARATFNQMGANAVRHPGLAGAVVAAGHEVGNHTWSHQDLAFCSARQAQRQLELGRDAIESVAGVRPRFFRPPRGELTGSALRAAAALGHDVLLWSVARGPAGVGTPAGVADHLGRSVGRGDVVALHDGVGRGTFRPGGRAAALLRARRAVEVAALPAALERIVAAGLRPVTASELLAAGAYTLTDTPRQ